MHFMTPSGCSSPPKLMPTLGRSWSHAPILGNDRLRGHFRQMTKDGDYHLLDFRLFYFNIRRNCEERVAAYVAQNLS